MNSPQAFALLAAWLLIFVRLIGFFVQANVWGSHHIPKPILVGCAAVFTTVFYPNVHIPKALFMIGAEIYQTKLINLGFLVFTQFTVGLMLGYIAFLVLAAVQFGAEILDVQMGLSVAASFDPGQGSVNMIRRFIFYVGMTVYVLMNGHMYDLRAVQESFDVVPLTGLNLNGHLMSYLIEKSFMVFTVGLQIASPIVAALFITQVALGLLARVAPQMNVFMLSFPLNIMIGLSLLAASMMMLDSRLYDLFHEQTRMIYHTINLLRPVGGG